MSPRDVRWSGVRFKRVLVSRAAIGQRDRILEFPLPAFVGHLYGSILPAGRVVPLALSLIKCASMAVQAFSASARVLKGEPPTFMALLF